MNRVIAQGAEAILKKNDFLTKERIKKSYRITEIDLRLRKRRTRSEANLLREASRIGIAAPKVLDQTEFVIKMEFIAGSRVKEALSKDNCNQIAEKIGSTIATLHNYNIIHGDLTTSNMILKSTNKTDEQFVPQLYLIDFGLGFFSHKTEDKAIDLHLLREALESTHFDIMEETWNAVLKSYRKGYKDSDKVIKTLSAIEKRGRYKKR